MSSRLRQYSGYQDLSAISGSVLSPCPRVRCISYSIVPRISVAGTEECEGLSIYSLTPPLQRTLGTVMREDRIVSRGMNEVLKKLDEILLKEKSR